MKGPTILREGFEWLEGRQRNDTSQFGEDGLIEALLEHFGAIKQWCFEVGAGNGVALSNTKRLRDLGWHAILIEAEDTQFNKLASLAGDRVRCVHERIGPDSLDQILARCEAPKDMDFGSIDIDGQDYWVWRGMVQYRPRIMSIEFSPYGAADQHVIPECRVDAPGQAGKEHILELGKAKGYISICHTFCNILFVTAELLKA